MSCERRNDRCARGASCSTARASRSGATSAPAWPRGRASGAAASIRADRRAPRTQPVVWNRCRPRRYPRAAWRLDRRRIVARTNSQTSWFAAGMLRRRPAEHCAGATTLLLFPCSRTAVCLPAHLGLLRKGGSRTRDKQVLDLSLCHLSYLSTSNQRVRCCLRNARRPVRRVRRQPTPIGPQLIHHSRACAAPAGGRPVPLLPPARS